MRVSEETVERLAERAIDPQMRDLALDLRDCRREIAEFRRPVVLHRGSEAADLRAHGETVLCTTEIVASLYENLAACEKDHAEAVRALKACDEALARYAEGYKKLADEYDNGWDCPHCSHSHPEDNGAFGHQPKDGEHGACPIGSALTRLDAVLSTPNARRVLEDK